MLCSSKIQMRLNVNDLDKHVDGGRSDLSLLCQDFDARLRNSSHTRAEADLSINESAVHETFAQLSDRCISKECAASLWIFSHAP